MYNTTIRLEEEHQTAFDDLDEGMAEWIRRKIEEDLLGRVQEGDKVIIETDFSHEYWNCPVCGRENPGFEPWDIEICRRCKTRFETDIVNEAEITEIPDHIKENSDQIRNSDT